MAINVKTEEHLLLIEINRPEKMNALTREMYSCLARAYYRLDTDEEQMAAALHDVIEDTDATPESLLALGVPKVVVEAVQSLTKRDGETYADFVARAGSHPIARRVKLADLADNSDPRRVAALRERNEALAAELKSVAAQLLAEADELEARKVGWEPVPPRYTTGVLAKYRKLVSSAADGAVCG